MKTWSRRTTVVTILAALGLVATVTRTLAALDDDGVHLRADWQNGGEAWLELEDRNALPVICFIWDNDAPQDGDGIESTILDRAGAEVVDLGIGDQWIDGSGSGCEVVRDDGFRDVFANPEEYVVEVRVVENQGTPVTPPLRSGPLEAHSGTGTVGTSGSGTDSGTTSGSRSSSGSN
ncbi:hypothetical protein [Geodermatophilus ruber]|uniref:Uncharacterized protein n=1 Tax=Geodermatophilus ruber TaxID=504800 RepID=A0A1I4E0A6_9ACTN|nr:hypothetical protein [Geodermatophilus ruber]SFK97977.1 hypothetical protein SAMN04488085_10597 [Geodermatophilus ruber]